MASGRYGLVLREVGRLWGGKSAASLGEGALLERFALGRDEAAFEALVTRHGPMVLGTCRRMLADPHDVDDAFQATFLVLARRAGSIRDADRLGPWLHGVARRVATRSRALSARRNARERPGPEEPAVESPNLLEGFELREALDEELARLPEKYRAPLVLCYLEGLTHDEAASHLRWPVGTVRSRLAGGRDRLRTRLTRRGLAPSAAVPMIAARSAIPQALLSTTVRVATSAGSAPAHVASLAKGALVAMIWNKLKVVAALGLMAGLTVGGAGLAAQKGGEGKAKVSIEEGPKDDQVKREMADLNAITIKAERARLKEELDAINKKMEQVKYDRRKELQPLEEQAAEIRSRGDSLERRWRELVSKGAIDAWIGTRDLADRLGVRSAELEKEFDEAQKQIRRLEAEWHSTRAAIDDLRKRMDAERAAAPAPGGLDDRKEIGRLTAELTSSQATTAGLKKQLDALKAQAPSAEPAAPKANPASPAIAMGGGIGGGTPPTADPPSANPPAPKATMQDLGGDPSLFAVIPPERDRITIIDSGTQKREVFRLTKGARSLIPVSGMGVGLQIKGPEVSRIAYYDRSEKRWFEHDLKEPATSVSTRHSFGGGGEVSLIGLEIQAPEVTRLAVFDFAEKKWMTQDLREPAPGGVNPTLMGSKAIYQIGRFVYVYSGLARKWAVLELGPKAKLDGQTGVTIQGTGKVAVYDGDLIHIYDPKTGDWTHIDTKDDK